MILKSSFKPSIFLYFHIFGKLILALRNLPAISYSIMGFSQLCKQANAKYCVTMVEEEKAAGGKAKEKIRRISVFYDLGSFPQLRSTTTHFPSEEILQYFQYTNTGKKD